MFISEQALTGPPDLTTAKFVYDKVEMGWNAIWNQTSVDFFGIPVQLQAGQSNPVGYKDSATRHSIFQALLAMPNPYNQFVYPVGATDPSEIYRMFSPSKAMSMTGAPWSYPSVNGLLEQAIDSGLPTLAGVTFNYGGFVMNFQSASRSARTVTLSVTDSNGQNPETTLLSSIDSAHAFADTIKWDPSTGDGGGAKAAGLIGAVINRGVLDDSTHWGESGGANRGLPQYYYLKSQGNSGEFNYYSQCLHDFAIGKLCYAISYDDFFHQDASISPTPEEWVRITVLPFS